MSRTTSYSETTVTVPDTDDIELVLGHCTSQDESDMFFHVAPDHIIVAYLVTDEDCADPLESQDGNGRVYSSSRNGQITARQGYQKALGLDSDFEPDFSLLDEQTVVETILADIANDQSTGGELFDKALAHCEIHWIRPTGMNDIEFIRDSYSDLDDLAPICDTSEYELAAWKKGRISGTIGDKYAVLLDVYEHGGVAYSLAGHGFQCRFDTARGGAVWVPDACAIENFEVKGATYEDNLEKARNYAKSCVAEYTNWVNGECYGYVIEKHMIDLEVTTGESEELEACWGFIGYSYAKEECEEMFNNVVQPGEENVPN